MLTEIIIIAILLTLSAFFSGAETAFMSLGKFKYKEYIRKKKKDYLLVQKLKDNPRKLLSTLLIGNNIVNIAIASIVTLSSSEYLLAHGLIWSKATIAGVTTGVSTLIVLIFGEIMPKTWAHTHYEKCIGFLIKPVYFLSILFTPIIFFFDFITRLASRNHKPNDRITEEEIRTMVSVGSDEGGIDNYEKHLIHRIFQFDDKIVKNIMTPISKVYSIDSKLKIKLVLKSLLEEGYSRVPVYEGTNNNLVGIFHLRDVLNSLEKNMVNLEVGAISSKPLFVLESKPIDDLFKEMQHKKVQMAIVINEKKEVVGLITLEDLLEEIVGEIYDEDENEGHLIRKIGKKEFLLNGEVTLREIMKKTSLKIDGLESETISSFIISKFGKIPKQGYELILKKGKLVVVKIVDKQIYSVKLNL